MRGGVQNLTVSAETYSEEMQYGDYLYYKQVDEDDDGTYDYIEITDCETSATEIVIPSEIDGLPVTSIGYFAFYDCTNLESITIGNSVISIGGFAFSWCENLTSIEIPDSVTSIEDGAFAFCSSLTSIEIPNGVTSIGDVAFEFCSSLTSIEIPNSVTWIGWCAFDGCKSLKSIEIPESVISIGEAAFYECDSLESITIYNPECWLCDEYDDCGIPANTIIYGYENSTAQEYAQTYGYKFAVIGSEYILMGDANGDGKITALDASTIAKLLAQVGISGETITVEDYPTMDYNGDGKITALDASAIAKYLAEKALQNTNI